MINIIITSYGEPNATAKAIDSFLNQDIKQEFQITVIDPFPEVETFLNEKYKGRVRFFLDPGEGKSYALNIFLEQIYSQNKEDIIILTDGDVYVSKNTVNEIMNAFKDKEIGCVTAKPVSLNPYNNRFGYWFKILFDGIDKVRKELSDNKQFFECSGYLFAIRNGVLKGFPLETSEDSIIPHLFWKQGYKIKYVPKAEVYVLNPSNWKDYKTQKMRNIKGHENLNKITEDMPRTKSFFNEIKHGLLFTILYPRSIKQAWWTIELMFTRLYIYLASFHDIKIKNKKYDDGWRKDDIASTRPMD